MAEYIEYHPLKFWLDPASIAEIVAHIQTYLVNNPINSTTEIETIIHDYLIAHPELIGGVDSVNGLTGEVVLTADNISGGENVTIKDVLDSLQDQIDDIVASIPSDYQQLIDDVSDLKSAISNFSEEIYSYTLRTETTSSTGYRLNESSGLCSSDSGYKLVKYTVTAGDMVKVVSDDRFQFQTVASVPSSGTSNRVGVTYGAGTFILTVPETATYLIVSTPTTSSAAVYDVQSTVSNNTHKIDNIMSVDGVYGDWISPKQIKGDYTEFETEVGNFYNSAHVIKTSANASYRRTLVNVTGIDSGYLVFPYDDIDPENGKMYVSSTATIDGTSENFIALLTPTASDTLKEYLGLKRIGGLWCVDIAKLKKSYPTAKALCPYSLASAWSTVYYYIPIVKILDWLQVTDENYGKNEPVVFWGDSMTRGATNSYNNPYPKQFESLSSLTVVNGGVGGESTSDILARQGAEPIIVEPVTIPDDTTPVEVSIAANTGQSLNILKSTDNEYWNVNPCIISGVEGALSYGSNKYYFTRTSAGSSVNVNRPVAVSTYAMRNLRDCPTVFWTQNNNEYSADVILNAFDVFVKYIQTTKYILMSPTKGYGSAYAELETKMTQIYGRKYINLREYLLEYGLSDLNITPTAQDLTDISQGVIPTSLKTDSVHFTTAAYGIVARLVYERGIELGYWD